ncbi:hypothetical protein AWB79_05454 [Caballeronia hypogeia]|uniref:Uncharacterized protein n=1 Tax=Caballeronia hypogeia TaxID=1777140 RepID=A0A158CL65_9BURK|nr:hypothetical protein [Caballeronia hypogeia]SAK82257.1 hypothetical protein AWB79_05454 [Caballeronia hypogeia]
MASLFASKLRRSRPPINVQLNPIRETADTELSFYRKLLLGPAALMSRSIDERPDTDGAAILGYN